MLKFIYNTLERQKPLYQHHVINDKASISCNFLKHNLNFNTPCVHIHVWLSTIEEPLQHPTGPKSIHTLFDNCCLSTCLILKSYFAFPHSWNSSIVQRHVPHSLIWISNFIVECITYSQVSYLGNIFKINPDFRVKISAPTAFAASTTGQSNFSESSQEKREVLLRCHV